MAKVKVKKNRRSQIAKKKLRRSAVLSKTKNKIVAKSNLLPNKKNYKNLYNFKKENILSKIKKGKGVEDQTFWDFSNSGVVVENNSNGIGFYDKATINKKAIKSKVKSHGKIYTPKFIVDNILDLADYKDNILGKHIIDNSCGDGAFKTLDLYNEIMLKM